jgi:hypothetical protein
LIREKGPVMEIHLRLKEFAQRYAQLSEEQFLGSFPEPVLIVDPGGKALDPIAFQAYAMTTTASELTEWEGPGFHGGEQAFVAPLAKSSRNAFPNLISVGRSSNNDIVIAHPRISKFHAFFKKNPSTGVLSLWEAGSTYGTAVAGSRLEQGYPAELESRTSIVFGDAVRATLLWPSDFYNFMKLDAPR